MKTSRQWWSRNHLHIKAFPPSNLQNPLSHTLYNIPQSQEDRRKVSQGKQNPLLTNQWHNKNCEVKFNTVTIQKSESQPGTNHHQPPHHNPHLSANILHKSALLLWKSLQPPLLFQTQPSLLPHHQLILPNKPLFKLT